MSSRHLILVSLVALVVLYAGSRSSAEEQPYQIRVRVVDGTGKPVAGAEVRARYLETVRQQGKEFQVPLELAPPQTTDAKGNCVLTARDVPWSLAGLKAHLEGVTVDEAIELYEDAPRDPPEREAFEDALNDLQSSYSTAFHVLDPKKKLDAPITMKMSEAIRVTGSVRVGGQPLAKAFVTVMSDWKPIDQLFPRYSPDLTDQDGRFLSYCVAGKLHRVRIVAERPDGNRVLTLTDVPSQKTDDGLQFKIEANAKDFRHERPR